MCLWYPDWALRTLGKPPDEPAQAVDHDGVVVAVNGPAAAAGIAVGMRRRQAEGFCPAVQSLIADPGAEAVAFEPVARAVEGLVPRIEIVHPGLALVPVTGALRYYGDEEALLGRVVERLDRLTGPGSRIGLAAGPFAARTAATLATGEAPVHRVADDAAFLRSLDVAALGRVGLAATFRWLGITTLGELAALPRQAMLSRFGVEGLEAHRLASGEDRSPSPRDVPADCSVEERFSPPLDNLEQAAFVARALANRLLGAMGGAAPHRVVVEAEVAGGAVRTRMWRSADPLGETALADRVRWQLRAWLDEAPRHDPKGDDDEDTGGGGLVRLTLAADEISDAGRQLALHEDARSAAEAHRALVQAQALVGPDRVLQARPQGGRDSRERTQWHRWGEEAKAPPRDPEAPWPGAVPAPSPALVPPEPPPFHVEWDDEGMPCRVRLGSRWVPVLSWAGPWRLTGRWWEGDSPADRYQIVTSAGAFLCERKGESVYLTGIYD